MVIMTATAAAEIPADVDQAVGSDIKASDDSCKPSTDPTPKAVDADDSSFTAIRQFDPSSSSPNEISQIQNLFAKGMASANAPSSYIERSLSSDIRDIDSMKETYCKGRGAFILMEKPTAEAAGGDGNDDCGNSNSLEIVGMVGLQDSSPQTGTSRQERTSKLAMFANYAECPSIPPTAAVALVPNLSRVAYRTPSPRDSMASSSIPVVG